MVYQEKSDMMQSTTSIEWKSSIQKNPPTETKVMVKDVSQTWYNL
jgi:hypothetical protein